MVDDSKVKDLLIASVEKIRQLKKEISNNESIQRVPIAIIGLSCEFPDGINSPDQLWNRLKNNTSMISDCPPDRQEQYQDKDNWLNRFGKKAGWLKDAGGFDASFFHFSPDEALRTDPQQRLFLQTAWHALEDAAIDPESLRQSNSSVFVGAYTADYHKRLYGYQDLSICQARDVMSAGQSFIAGRLAYFLGLNGGAITFDTACSSSLVAINSAVQDLRLKRCDLAIAGGVNLLADQELTMTMAKAGMLSPDQCCRPFDINANGIVRSEGCGVVILKRLDKAVLDGDPIRAVIVGTAITQDGASSGPTVPYGPAQEKLIKLAIKDAGIEIEQIGYVETHGTGTPLGDPIELEALSDVFAKSHNNNKLYIGSIKSNLGHLEAAAGIAGLIKTVLMIENKTLIANINFTQGNSAINWDFSPIKVVTQNMPWITRLYAGVSSFGLSGTNAHIIIGPSPTRHISEKNKQEDTVIIPLSARTLPQLQSLAFSLAQYEQGTLNQWQKILTTGRTHFSHRLIWKGNNLDNLKQSLLTFSHGKINDEILYKTNNSPATVTYFFTGQGSQYWQMCLNWYQIFPEFKNTLNQCNQLYENFFGESLIDILFEPKGIDLIDQTHYAQPALFALQYSLAKQWQALGVFPESVLGHSIGEFAAATIAGVLSLEDAIKLVGWRGKLMQKMPSDGGMIAILSDTNTITKCIDAILSVNNSDSSLEISVYNGQKQNVVSGQTDLLNELSNELTKQNIIHQSLTVSHAFHSVQMKGMLDEFRCIAEQITYQPAKLPIYSTVTGELLANHDIDANYWIKHIISPVRYDKALDTILTKQTNSAENNGIVLEMGPRPVLSKLAQSHPQANKKIWLVSQDPDGKFTAMNESISYLYCHGIKIAWSAFKLISPEETVYHLPGYPFQRKNYWLPLPYLKEPEKALNNQLNQKMPEDSVMVLSHEYITPDDWLTFITQEICQVLGIEQDESHPNKDDNLLQWGIDSILLLRLIQRWKKITGRQLTISDALSNPSLLAWSQILESSNQVDNDIKLIDSTNNIKNIYPLTPVQRAYWAGRHNDMPLGGVACYLYQEMSTKHLDLIRLENAFNQLIIRHDALRTRILNDGQQEVMASIPYQSIPFHDLSKLSEEQANQELIIIRERLSHHVADCMQPPLIIIEVIKLPNNDFHLGIGVDFLIADALSLSIFWRELSQLYLAPDTQLAPINLHFSSYVTAMDELKESKSYQQAKNYWANRIQTFSPIPELPLKQSPELIKNHRFERLSHTLTSNKWQLFKGKASRIGITPSVAILTAYSQILSRWSVNKSFRLTLTLFNRLPIHNEIENIIADFTNLILLDINSENLDYVTLSKQIQNQLATDLQYRDFSAIELLDLARQQDKELASPVVFTSTLGLGKDTLFDSSVFGKPIYGISQTPQVWLDLQIYEDNNELLLCWDFVETLFPEEVIKSMFESFTHYLEYLAVCEIEDWRCSSVIPLPKLTAQTRQQVNATEKKLPLQLLHQGFFDNAMRNPNHLAIIYHNQTLSYSELNNWVGRIISCLQQHKIMPQERIAIIMSKHPAQIAACLAILSCEAVFVPIDIKQPIERQNQLITQSNCRIILNLHHNNQLLDTSIQITVTEDAVSMYPITLPNITYSLQQLAYIIFTSGSTGTPKGVMISHQSAANTLYDINQRFNVTGNDRILAISALHFDLSIYDIFGLFNAGGTVVLVDDDAHYEPNSWYQYCQTYCITIWNSVPQLLDLLVDYCEKSNLPLPSYLRLALVSGDWIPLSLFARGKKCKAQYQLIGLGGATEASIWSNYFIINQQNSNWHSVPYGYPLTNQSFSILDSQLLDCPDWVIGDIYIGGMGLALGYLGDIEKTKTSFITHPITKARLYRTGDKGRYWSDGTIEFLGRDDNQVKINGYRVELGEIENKLRLSPNVEQAIVQFNNKQLIAFIVISQNSSEMNIDYKNWLEQYLPYYMIPNQFIYLKSLPLTANGKIDNKALVKLAFSSANIANLSQIRPIVEQNHYSVTDQIISILKKLLSVSSINLSDNLLRLGASSIDMIRLLNELDKTFGYRPKINELTRLENVYALVELYQKLQPNEESSGTHQRWQIYLKNTQLIDDVDARELYKKSRYQLRTNLKNGLELPNLKADEKNCFEQRKSCRQFSTNTLSLLQLTNLLNLLKPNAVGRHRYASAGATYPVQLYLYLSADTVSGLKQGIYYYQPYDNKLYLLDEREINLTQYSMSCRLWQSYIGLAIFLVAELKAIAPLYGSSSREFSFIEAGAICQLLESNSRQFGIGLCQVGDFDFEQIADRIAMSDSQSYLHVLMGGAIESNAQQIGTIIHSMEEGEL